jgi:hypothetical protein
MVAYKRGHFVDTLSQASAGDQPGARFGRKVPELATARNWKQTKNDTIEANMFLKTKGSTSKTNLKRTPIECEMRALNAHFKLFDNAHAPAGDWNGGTPQGSKLPGRGSAQKYKNSGNEAKKYLKTNDITFFVAANCAHFTRKSAQIER